MLFVDLAAIPDFATGAMENWGLITYRETAILYDPIESSTTAHQCIAIIIAHELAHQVLIITTNQILYHFIETISINIVVWQFGDNEMVE